MLRIACVAAGLAGLMAVPALAQVNETGPQPTTPITATDTADGFDPEKVICRKAAPPTGTRVVGRSRQQICMTRADWDQLAQDSQDAHADMDDPTANEEFLGGAES